MSQNTHDRVAECLGCKRIRRLVKGLYCDECLAKQDTHTSPRPDVQPAD